jgi:hypothetical protein
MTYSPTPDLAAPPTATLVNIVGDVATYSVTINSDTAGDFDVSAATTVAMGGVTVSRATGDNFTSGDGSDGQSAVKHYVSIATVVQPSSSVDLGTSIFDTAHVSGQVSATGTVTFQLFNNDTGTGPALFTDTEPVSASGDATSASTSQPVGSYFWVATYNSNDSNNVTTSSGLASEPQSVTGTPVTITTTVQPSISLALGGTVFDTATISGQATGFPATGTVTYTFSGTGGTTLPTLPAGSSFTLVAGTWQETVTLVTVAGVGTVPNSDTTPPLPAGSYQFQAVYSGDTNYTGGPFTSDVEPLSVAQASSQTATVIEDGVTSGTPTNALGETVFDTATVTGSPFTPTGTVTYTFSGTGGTTLPTLPAGSSFTLVAGTWQETVTLNADGSVPNSDTTPQLPAGSYQFQAKYSGDSNYIGSTSSVEPLTIAKANSSTATVIEDGVTSGTPTNALGETVFDTATVTGSPFTPTGTVTYTFSGTGGTTLPTLPAGSSFTLTAAGTWTETVTLTASGAVPNSDTTPALPAGTYQFQAKYNGDSNYKSSTSSVEPLTINLGNSNTVTVIKPSSSVTAGSTVFDTATVTGSPFTPTGTVTYTFSGTGGTTLPTLPAGSSFTLTAAGTWTETVTLTAAGAVPNSDTTPALPAGSYQFQAVYSGDSNYKSSTSSVEPLTVTTVTPALTWGFWKNHTGLDSPVDAWPVGNFNLGDGVSYHGVQTTLNGKKVVSNSTTMTVGGTTYTFQQLRSIFASSVNGNAVINLGHQLIAAILNVANGAGTPTALSLIHQASDLLASGSTKTPGPLVMGVSVVTSTSDPTLYAQLISLESQLDAFNSSGV